LKNLKELFCQQLFFFAIDGIYNLNNSA